MMRRVHLRGVTLLGLLFCSVLQPGSKEPSLEETKQYILDKMNALGSGAVTVAFDGDSLVFTTKEKTYTVPLPEMDADRIYYLTDVRDRQKCVGFHFKAVSSRPVIKVEAADGTSRMTDEDSIQDGFRGSSDDGEKIHRALLHAHKLMGGKKELF